MQTKQLTCSLAAVASLLLVGTPSLAGDVDPNLLSVMGQAPRGSMVSVLVYMSDPLDVRAMDDELTGQRATRQARHEMVVRALRGRAGESQADLLKDLARLQEIGEVASFKPFWIANAVQVEAKPNAILELAARVDVAKVFLAYPIEGIRPVDLRQNEKGDPILEAGGEIGDGPELGPVLGDRGSDSTPPLAASTGVIEPGLLAIKADVCWAAGFDGSGILLADVDSGVEGDHPALASRWAGTLPQYATHPDWAWLDPVLGPSDFPWDPNGHGTHTTGIMCGGLPGDQIGVAPGARWIAASPIQGGDDTIVEIIESFEWLIDPDGDPGTVWDVPHVCSNSWGIYDGVGGGPSTCDETLWQFLDAVEAAGTVVIFAAGNQAEAGLRWPPNRATDDYRSLAVAAVDSEEVGWPIAWFSSRGPSFCTPDGSPAIKPEVAAPGVSIRSSYRGGIYNLLSGTSMAAPHISGVVALVRQACPDLSVTEVKQVLYGATVDLGQPGDDNDYGHGMIDAFQAVQLALELCGATPPIVQDAWYAVPFQTPYQITLVAADYDQEPTPPMLTYEIVSLPSDGSLADLGNGHVITESELPYVLIEGGNSVEYVPANGFSSTDLFMYRADDGGDPPSGGHSANATVTLLVQFGPPTIVTPSVLPQGYQGFPYPPVALEAYQGQPELVWEVLPVPYAEVDLGFNAYEVVGVAQDWHADDGAWTYVLPFPFPYYGVDRSQVTVSSNGWLNFGTSTGSSASNSLQRLISNTRICPLWDDQRTNFSDADIYIDESIVDQVTIRWDTVTYVGQHPCEYSCTLYADGRIRFAYGPGNTPITATIGISAGNGVDYLVSSYDGVSNLDNVDSLEYLVVGPLKDGMTLSPAGILSGIPAEAGLSRSLIQVTDALLRTDKRVFDLVVTDEVPCLNDLDGDGAIGGADLTILLGSWGEFGSVADLTGDGTVDGADLTILLGAWGECP